MEATSIIRLALIGYGLVAIVYACIGTDFLTDGEVGWWDRLPKQKRILFVTGVGASVLQTFL